MKEGKRVGNASGHAIGRFYRGRYPEAVFAETFERRTEGEEGRQVDVWGSGLLKKEVASVKAMQ